MRKKTLKKRKTINFSLPKLKKSTNLRHNKLAHNYDIDGEDLIKPPSMSISKKIGSTILIALPIFFLILYVINGIVILFKNIYVNVFRDQPIVLKKLFSGFTLEKISLPNWLVVLVAVTALIIAVVVMIELIFKTKKITYGQKGDSRLATNKEIEAQFKGIPDAGIPFSGYGGIPVSHCERALTQLTSGTGTYFIEDGTFNSCVVGTSRSGKGQTTVLAMLENISRAEKQCSLVTGDPKGELYAAAEEPLTARGYDVYAYNLINPIRGMGDDPLGLIKKYYRQGNTEYALQLINTLTFTLYNDPKAGENSFFNTSAAKVVNALILTLLKDAESSGEWEKVTMNNVAELLTSVAQVKYVKDPDNPFNEVNALDEYFKSLPANDLAAKQYAGANFSGEKAKGSILATVAEKLTPFTMPSIAKMTSRSSFDLKSVGFQKYIDFKVSGDLINQTLLLKFINGKTGELIGTINAAIGANGFIEVNHDFKLHDQDILQIIAPNETKAVYQLTIENKPKHYHVDLKVLDSEFNIEKIEVAYSERPIALFLMLPDYDPSNHVLASIFISQLYTELSYQCSRTIGNKCYRRIHYVLDEFGNLPAIANMDQILTVTNGRNMLWHLFVQAYSQIYNKYGKEAGETIKQNCQTRILIFTTDDATIEGFSKNVGSRTVEGINVDLSSSKLNKTQHASAESERILTYERLSQMLEGEMCVLRPLHRRNLKGRKIRPYPIFNKGKNTMPYAYQFLTKYGFDPGRDVNTLQFDSPNAKLDLAELRTDFSKFIVDSDARSEYLRVQSNFPN